MTSLCDCILAASAYLTDWRLTDDEVEQMLSQYDDAMRTINGDTGPVMITARQLVLLLRAHALNDGTGIRVAVGQLVGPGPA